MFHMNGVADYDWTLFSQYSPPLNQEEKERIADIVDSLNTKEDVKAWVEKAQAQGETSESAKKAYLRQLGPVLTLAEKKKVIDLSPMFASITAAPTKIDDPPKKDNDPPKIEGEKETPWLLYAGGALLLYMILKK